MRTLGNALGIMAAILGTAVAGTAIAQERLLVQQPDMLVVADREVACGQPFAITVRAAEPALFENGERLQRTVDGVRAMLGFECARLPRLDITGEAGREQEVVYRGVAGDGTAWLVEGQGPAPSGSTGASTGSAGGPLATTTGASLPSVDGPEVAGVRLGMTVEQAMDAAEGSFGNRPDYRDEARMMQAMTGGCDFRFGADRAPVPGWRCLEGVFTKGDTPRLHTVGLAQAIDQDQRDAIEARLIERYGPPDRSIRRDEAGGSGGFPFLYLAWGDVLSRERGSRLGFLDAPLRKLEAYAEVRDNLTVVNIWNQDPAIAVAATPEHRLKF